MVEPISTQPRWISRYSPRQQELIQTMLASPRPKILYGGGGGSGKSFGLRGALITYHLYHGLIRGVHGVRTMLACDTYNTLRDRFYSKFNIEYRNLGRIKNSQTYGLAFHFRNENLGIIALRNLDDPDKYRGTEAAAIAIDEASVMPALVNGEPILNLLCYPLRTSLPVTSTPLILASNWDGPGFSWLKAAWWDKRDFQGLNESDFHYIPALIDDNPDGRFVSQFKPLLESLRGHLRQSRLLGIPTQPSGAMFPLLEEGVQIFRREEKFPKGIPDDFPQIIGVDWGMADPYCALWTAVDLNGDFWTYQEDYHANLLTRHQVQRILTKTPERAQISSVYCDPAMWSRGARNAHTGAPIPPVILAYHEGLQSDARFGAILKGDNSSRVFGFAHLADLLDHRPGRPRWFIDKGCTHLLTELEAAVYDDRAGFSEDIHPKCRDHALTAAYYHLRTHHRASQPLDWNAARKQTHLEREDLAWQSFFGDEDTVI